MGRGLAGRVALGRRTIALDDVAEDALVNPALLDAGVHSVLGVPLFSHGQVIGVLKAGSRQHRTFTSADIAAAEGVGLEVSATLEEYFAADERSAAVSLQRSLMPTRLPALPGLDMAGRYVPGQGGVSGDWYDVFELPDGRIGMVMGDVAGHGLPASVVMGRLRSALRAYALEHADPAEVLRRLDAKLFHFEPGAVATAIYAITEPPFEQVRIASAGHLLPILLDPDSVAGQVEVPVSLPLGVDPACERTSAVIDFAEDCVLVLFTDGLIERRSTGTPRSAEVFGSIDAALEELCRLVEPSDANTACARILDSMLTLEPPGDDVAVLVVRHVGGAR
jgi:serine phosphatase RsbU (regulator of sigma subunit)